jgi:hypothetical protein
MPIAVPILGGLSVAVGLFTLCGGGLAMIHPESGVAPAAFAPVFESGAVRATFFTSVSLWIAFAALLIAAGVGLLLGRRRARLLGLIYAWGSVGCAVLVAALYVTTVVPVLSAQSLGVGDFLELSLVGPTTGCCPVTWALVMLAVLYHDRIASWSRETPSTGRPSSTSA